MNMHDARANGLFGVGGASAGFASLGFVGAVDSGPGPSRGFSGAGDSATTTTTTGPPFTSPGGFLGRGSIGGSFQGGFRGVIGDGHEGLILPSSGDDGVRGGIGVGGVGGGTSSDAEAAAVVSRRFHAMPFPGPLGAGDDDDDDDALAAAAAAARGAREPSHGGSSGNSEYDAVAFRAEDGKGGDGDGDDDDDDDDDPLDALLRSCTNVDVAAADDALEPIAWVAGVIDPDVVDPAGGGGGGSAEKTRAAAATKSLRNGVHHANAVVWEPVTTTTTTETEDAPSLLESPPPPPSTTTRPINNKKMDRSDSMNRVASLERMNYQKTRTATRGGSPSPLGDPQRKASAASAIA